MTSHAGYFILPRPLLAAVQMETAVLNVLLFLGFPLSLVGLVALPWQVSHDSHEGMRICASLPFAASSSVTVRPTAGLLIV